MLRLRHFMKEIRTRFAPSPTGFLHIGGLRTALFCYAWAKKNNGTFLLRIEDTDQNRYVQGAVKQIIDSLAWAGVTPDEGVVGGENDQIIQKGDLGPYIQSERIDLYKKYAQELLDEKKAYKCWCTSERLEEMRAAQRAAKQMPKYDRHCLHIPAEEKAKNESENIPFVIRFHVPDIKEVGWDDVVFGKMKFDGDQIDDLVILKADGFPTYNFANVIDDHLMQISHVIRGQEFLSSTPKHILLYEAFGWEIPEMVHVAWILGKNKQKLSKRDNSVAVDDYIQMGILPDALNNYLALLGWNPGGDRELYSLEDIVKEFDVSNAQKSGAVWDLEKLLWFNGQYIRNLSDEEYVNQSITTLIDEGVISQNEDKFTYTETGETLDKKLVHGALHLERERIKRFQDLAEKVVFFFSGNLQYNVDDLIWKKGKREDLDEVFPLIQAKLNDLAEWDQQFIKDALFSITQETEWGVGDIFWPTRVALSGAKQSPGPDEIASVLGKEETLARINNAVDKLS